MILVIEVLPSRNNNPLNFGLHMSINVHAYMLLDITYKTALNILIRQESHQYFVGL